MQQVGPVLFAGGGPSRDYNVVKWRVKVVVEGKPDGELPDLSGKSR